jgi:hypothetical protein
MKQKMAPHKHLWQDRYTRDWRYVCSVCGLKSRNDFCQRPEFQEPYIITSIVLIGPGAGTVSQTVMPTPCIANDRRHDDD